MNETSSTSASGTSLLPDGIGTLTAIHFTIIGVLAILVVIGLMWGIRAKRSRVKASRDVVTNAEEAGVPPEPISAKPAVDERKAEQFQTQTQTAPVPVAPPPAPPQSAPTQSAPTQSAPPVRAAPDQIPVSRDGEVSDTPERLTDEPIAAASPLEASPATEAVTHAPVAPAEAPAEPHIPALSPAQSYADEPVTQLKGLGPKVAVQLAALGVSTVGQMAALSENQAQSIDAQLGNFTGRMGRDRWIEQARLLAAGDKAGFETVFGKL